MTTTTLSTTSTPNTTGNTRASIPTWLSAITESAGDTPMNPMRNGKLELSFFPCGPGREIVQFSGSLVHGVDSAGKARKALNALIENNYSQIIVDLGNLKEIDAAGVEAIVAAAAAAQNAPATRLDVSRLPPLLALSLQVRLLTAG